MRKIKLFIVVLFMFMLIPSVYAASTVEEVSNIKIPPLLSEKKFFYINNMKNYTITINDNKHIIIHMKYIGIK